MIDLAQVKLHLRVDHDDEDVLIQGYMDAALSAFELFTRRTLVMDAESLPDPVGNALVITKAIVQGALMLVGHWYVNRESTPAAGAVVELPMATNALWRPHVWAKL